MGLGHRSSHGWGAAAILILLSSCQAMLAQSSNQGTRTFSLEEAVNFALQNYPAVRGSLERVSAAQAGVALARTNYLPRADALWQVNRATRNNVFGVLLPQSVVPPLSGPVLPTTSHQGVWGSAAGLLFSWEPFDFGYRRAEINAARAVQDRANAEVAVTRLDVAVATVNAYLTLVAAEQTVRAAQADFERREIFAMSVHVLANNQLRPGADASRADAELARARSSFARARQQEEVSRARLASLLGIANTRVEVQATPLVGVPPETNPPVAGVAMNPVVGAQQARVEELRARTQVLDRAYLPKLNLQSAVFGRGSGANADGTLAGGANGLGLDRSNWAVGLTVRFSAFDFFSIRARKAAETANERAQVARYDQAIQDLTGRLREAEASLEGARQVAENTPVELNAARATETQARARYQAGLATITDVSDAQGLLVQAEIDDALARLVVWQNLASVAAVQGDLTHFVGILRQRRQGGP